MADRSETVRAILADLQAGVSVEESFRRLCEIYTRPVHHFFAKRGFSPQDCLDLTQETFLGIYRGVGSFRWDAPFETWLFKVAANALRKRLRSGAAGKRAGQEVPIETEEPEGGPVPGEDLLAGERARLLREAIGRLPEQMRKCLLLRVDQEMRYKEIAVVLRLSPETVKVHLFQARKRLREELGPYFGDALDEALLS